MVCFKIIKKLPRLPRQFFEFENWFFSQFSFTHLVPEILPLRTPYKFEECESRIQDYDA